MSPGPTWPQSPFAEYINTLEANAIERIKFLISRKRSPGPPREDPIKSFADKFLASRLVNPDPCNLRNGKSIIY